jgi:hypothetical protein
MANAAPLLTTNGRGLIAQIGQYGAVADYHGLAYGAQKDGADKIAADMAKELRPYNEVRWRSNTCIHSAP